MDMVKIRRVGNSNTITVPSSWVARGYTAGSRVVIEEGPRGEMIVLPESVVRSLIRETGRRVIEEDRKALEMLAAYDRGEIDEDDLK